MYSLCLIRPVFLYSDYFRGEHCSRVDIILVTSLRLTCVKVEGKGHFSRIYIHIYDRLISSGGFLFSLKPLMDFHSPLFIKTTTTKIVYYLNNIKSVNKICYRILDDRL